MIIKTAKLLTCRLNLHDPYRTRPRLPMADSPGFKGVEFPFRVIPRRCLRGARLVAGKS